MAEDGQRAKARQMFGKAFMAAAKPMAPPKNFATAQQKVANSRPIPTYKVGGPVKKAAGGLPAAREQAIAFQAGVDEMPRLAAGGAGKVRKGQAPIKRAEGGPAKPTKDGSKKDAEYGDWVAGDKDRKQTKPVRKAAGGVGKLRKGMCD